MSEARVNPKQYLVQEFVEIGPNEGAWISLKIFKNRDEAQRYLDNLKTDKKTRVLESVLVAAR